MYGSSFIAGSDDTLHGMQLISLSEFYSQQFHKAVWSHARYSSYCAEANEIKLNLVLKHPLNTPRSCNPPA